LFVTYIVQRRVHFGFINFCNSCLEKSILLLQIVENLKILPEKYFSRCPFLEYPRRGDPPGSKIFFHILQDVPSGGSSAPEISGAELPQILKYFSKFSRGPLLRKFCSGDPRNADFPRF
jgi:hypothetical protein